MKSLLIKDTTEEERRRIVEESLGMPGACDDCMSSIGDMYDDYIYGKPVSYTHLRAHET